MCVCVVCTCSTPAPLTHTPSLARCLVFYPFFYGIGAFPLVRAATDISPAEAAAAYGLFFVGWALTRGANLQKFYKRRNPESTHCFLGLVRQVLQHCFFAALLCLHLISVCV
jgi:hypothetical protein